MKIISRLYLCSFLMFFPGTLISQKKRDRNAQLEIEFLHYVGNEILKLDSITYKNELAQDFTISKYKYYIGNIHLKRKGEKDYIYNQYFLVNEEIRSSKSLVLEKIPFGEYTSISFTIGVDSLSNCSGAQSGALDPINTMFWTWNTGYIFMKLEGNSPFSLSPGGILEYHIGGFQNPYNCIRTISLEFDEVLIIDSNKKQNKQIKTDILEILKTPTVVDFSKLSSVTDFNNSTTIADNYSDMFQIVH